MASDTIEVSHCGECPLHHSMLDSGGAMFEQCLREGRQIWPDDPERPEWCPLEGAPVTIRLREDAETPEPEQSMPRVNGKPFRCECGCNVFTRRGNRYTCNGCGANYRGEP